MTRFMITDTIGQCHVFNYVGKDSNGKEVKDTIRLNARETVSVEMESLPEDLELAEKAGFVMIEREQVSTSTASTTSKGGKE